MRAVTTLAMLVASAALSWSVSAAEAPRFEVDASWPKTLPNQWIMGQAAGVAADDDEHIWVIQRPEDADGGREGRLPQSADDQMLRAGATGHGVCPGRHAAGLRLAAERARHPYRSEGLCLDRRQRRRGRANSEVHEGRQIRPADRPSRRADQFRRYVAARPPGQYDGR